MRPSDRSKVTILIISSPEGVRENIHELHQRGYAEASLWSGLLPSSNPGEVMSILVRHRSIETMVELCPPKVPFL